MNEAVTTDGWAEWRAADVRCGADGSTFRVIGPGGVEADASVALPGPFNVANALGAIVALVEAGVDLADAVSGVASCPGVPGRLQRVPLPRQETTDRDHRETAARYDFGGRGAAPRGLPDAFVVYSHKPGAVEAVLTALRPVTSGTQQIDLMPSAISVGAPAGPKAARSASPNIVTTPR